LLDKGRQVAVLSRGYRRQAASTFRVVSDGKEMLANVEEAGDEPLELAQSIEGLVVAVGRDRFLAGLEVMRTSNADVFVLDDAFQHRRLYRDLDLVCIDAHESPRDLSLLPVGRMREPLTSLNRASGILWTRWGPGYPSEALASRVLGALRSEVPVFRVRQTTRGFTALAGREERLEPDGLDGEPVGLLAGIARPARFEEDLEACGARVVWSVARRDHHRWQPAEVVQLVEDAKANGARAVVTTGKDAVKLGAIGELSLPLYRMDIELEVLERESFQQLLVSALPSE
jgi:tetraacyldisaccharide 4'-kinase